MNKLSQYKEEALLIRPDAYEHTPTELLFAKRILELCNLVEKKDEAFKLISIRPDDDEIAIEYLISRYQIANKALALTDQLGEEEK